MTLPLLCLVLPIGILVIAILLNNDSRDVVIELEEE